MHGVAPTMHKRGADIARMRGMPVKLLCVDAWDRGGPCAHFYDANFDPWDVRS